MKKRVIPLIVLGALLVYAVAQQSSRPEQSVSYPVMAGAGGGFAGSIFIGSARDDTTVVVLALHGTAAGADHPAHLHEGDCGSGGGVRIPLADVDGATGLSVTLVPAPFEEVTSADYHVNAHRSAQDMGTIVACGEVGSLAEGAASAAQGKDKQAQGDRGGAMGQAAQGSLRTASYQLFPVGSGGVGGSLNVSEQVEGGTRFVVTLPAIEPGQRFAPVLFSGDCGPDRERVLDLPPVGSMANDPYTSISDTELSFDEVSTGDYFLYIYGEGGKGEPLACGEVGEGANR